VSIGNSELQSVFGRLRELLAAHASEFAIAFDTTDRYGLDAPVGPATLRAWGGKARIPRIPIAWVEIRKAYVSYHLIGLDGNTKLLANLSQPLRVAPYDDRRFRLEGNSTAIRGTSSSTGRTYRSSAISSSRSRRATGRGSSR